MGFWGIGERELLAYQGAQRAILQSSHEGGMRSSEFLRCHGEEQHPVDGCFTSHRAARVDFHPAPASDDYDASMPGEERQILVEIDVRGHFEDDVDPLASRRL